MCGLVGVAGALTKKELNVFTQLLWVGGLRGMDNTGAASVDRSDNGLVRSVKVAGGPEKALESKLYDKVVDYNKIVIIGHNRTKTHGSDHHRNAHPFIFDNIIGAHNGVLGRATRNAMYDQHLYETDSQSIFSNIEKFGIEETVKHFDGVLDAYALVWYNAKDRSINFLRNNQRPLFYAFNDTCETLYWASEKAMLYLCLNRNEVKFQNVFTPKEHVHISFIIPAEWNQKFDKGVRVERKPPFELVVRNVPRAFPHGSSQIGNEGFNGVARSHTPVKVFDNINSLRSTFPDLFEKGKLRLSFMRSDTDNNWDYYNGYDMGAVVYEEDFKMMAATGCFNCNQTPVWGEPVKFMKDGTFLCAPCLINNRSNVIEQVREFL